MNFATLAELLIKGFLEPKGVAVLLNINEKLQPLLTLTLIEELSNEQKDINRIQKILKEYVTQQLGATDQDKNKLAQTGRKKNTAEKTLSLIDAGIKSARNSMSETASDLMNSDLLQQAAADLLLPGVCQLGNSLYNEVIFLNKMSAIQNALKIAEEQSSITYRAIQSEHLKVKNIYNMALSEIKKNEPVDKESYKKTLEAWLMQKMLAKHLITLQQERLATIGSESQEAQSIRRYERITEGLGAAIAIASLAGPPVALAGTAIKLMVAAGAALYGSKKVKESAELNHGIVHIKNILMITGPIKPGEIKENIAESIRPSIAFSGPLLESRKIFGTEIAKAAYQKLSYFDYIQQNGAAPLAKLMAENAKGRSSCAYVPMTSTQYIPPFDPDLFEGTFASNPKLKEAGKKALDDLIDRAKAIYTELLLLHQTIIQLTTNNEQAPFLTNLNEITSQLSTTLDEIRKQQSLINEKMGDDYPASSEGRKKSAELSALLENSKFELNQINYKEVHFGDSPFSSLFKNGEPIDLVTIEENERKEILIAFQGDGPNKREARKILENETNSNIQSLLAIISAQKESPVKGKYIRNFDTAIRELQEKNILLHDADPKNPAFTTNIENLHKIAGNATEQIADRIDQLTERINQLNQPGNVFSPEEIYEELNSIHASLSNLAAFYDRNLQYIEKNKIEGLYNVAKWMNPAKREIQSLQQDITHLQNKMLPNLENSLNTAPVFMNQTIPSNDAVIQNVSRRFFGFNKHKDIAADVVEKVAELEAENISQISLAQISSITEEKIISCINDSSKLASLFEGLKTEIQWVVKFSETCDGKIAILNINALIESYQNQIMLIEKTLNEIEPGRFLRLTEEAKESVGLFEKIKVNVSDAYSKIVRTPEREFKAAKEALSELSKIQQNSEVQLPELDTPRFGQ